MMATRPGDLGFDPEALRRKYREERDKRLRLRPEALGQYIRPAGQFERYEHDPYVDTSGDREPLNDEMDAVILGGGWCGVLAAVRLREAGVKRVRIIDKAGDFGGVWYWNRYPGLRCDIDSYIYLPLLEETGYMPSEKYVRGEEIYDHFKRIAEHYDLYRDACFQTKVTNIRWNEESARWLIETDRDDEIRARFVCLGGAGLHRPKLPGTPGLEDFRGRAFHTSRWDYQYTGGDTYGGLTELTDKTVAVIGTGATAVQVVPSVAKWAKHLYVVQRTPSTVGFRNNKPTDERWASALTPGWQARRIMNFTAIVSGVPQDEDLVDDAWTDSARKVAMFTGAALGQSQDAAQLADYRRMEELRDRVKQVVNDPADIDALQPWYNYACKRPSFSDDYLPTFNESNVTLVNTDGRGLDKFTEHGFEFDGEQYEVDCVIFATGFETFLPIYETGGFDIVGREGRSLAARWSDGFKSLHGMLVHEFPNMFIYGAKPHTASTANLTHIVDIQARHIAAVVKRCNEIGADVIEVRTEAEGRWQEVIDANRVDGTAFYEECTPGYINYEGAQGKKYLLAESYGGGPFKYAELCADWLDDGFQQDTEVLRTFEPAREVGP